ncbi:hypothetical protein LXH13_12670 [Streptomyces spinosirectus]|jgi:hypothetical protein|uniref:hypothetical protein n=1 Tax=Streptomyces TaxID=1883 RepID=UPI000D3A9A88|nr:MULTISPECIES: hypothetical protein [Streptomyces]MBY8342523.1 hypothetical protein [Streptomyces plumbidurans]PTM99457.1 hypothetical protein C7821_102404 [Streptomyces sp. VMFN-G11Ma]UIR17837.1 hypothetical protein LXH13_12670 [Streptomyces spinosirectus]
MSTGLIIALIVIVAAVVVVAAVLALRNRGPRGGGRDLKRRFGPEYDRTVARHDGDTKAAERELTGRVERHGALRVRPLEADRREQYTARWTAAQERFVDAPHEAVAEADRLLAELAAERGFPDGGQYEEQLAALSVHHAHHVHGYRHIHRVARASAGGQDGAGTDTEEMREAMVEARALFEDLTAHDGHDGTAHRTDGTDPADRAQAHSTDRTEKSHGEGRSALPWAFDRRQAKGS